MLKFLNVFLRILQVPTWTTHPTRPALVELELSLENEHQMA